MQDPKGFLSELNFLGKYDDDDDGLIEISFLAMMTNNGYVELTNTMTTITNMMMVKLMMIIILLIILQLIIIVLKTMVVKSVMMGFLPLQSARLTWLCPSCSTN